MSKKKYTHWYTKLWLFWADKIRKPAVSRNKPLVFFYSQDEWGSGSGCSTLTSMEHLSKIRFFKGKQKLDWPSQCAWKCCNIFFLWCNLGWKPTGVTEICCWCDQEGCMFNLIFLKLFLFLIDIRIAVALSWDIRCSVYFLEWNTSMYYICQVLRRIILWFVPALNL